MQANILQLNIQPVKNEPVKASTKQSAVSTSLKQSSQNGKSSSADKAGQDFKDVLQSEDSKAAPQDLENNAASDKAADDTAAALLAAQLGGQTAVLNVANVQTENGLAEGVLADDMLTGIADKSSAAFMPSFGNSMQAAQLLQQMSNQTAVQLGAAQLETAQVTDASVQLSVMDLENNAAATAASRLLGENKAAVSGQNIAELVGSVISDNDTALNSTDNKNAAIRNLDFLAKINVGAADAESETSLQAQLTSAADLAEAAAGSKNAKVSTASENVLAVNNSLKTAAENTELKANSQTSGVLTDEQLALELKNAQASVKTTLPRAVTSKDNAEAIVASLSDKLQSLNEALGIKTEPEANNGSKSVNQVSFAQSLGMTERLNEASSQTAVKSEAASGNTADYNIPKQIVEQARLFKTADASEMVIKLKPEHLGELTLKVIVGANGAVSASFRSDNPEVRGAIESSILQLKQELQQQGLKVDNIDVDIYGGQEQLFGGESGGNAAEQQNKQSKQASWEELESDELGTEELTEEALSEGDADSVNYLV